MLEPQIIELDDARRWLGLDVFDRDGERVGKLSEIFLSSTTGRPEFALVKTGLFGLRSSFVPLAGASLEDGVLVVDFYKPLIRDAPAMPKGAEEISGDAETEVYRHYGLTQPAGESPSLVRWEL
jgi:sporulation protein YlmC with PRC-barrel domain